MLHLLKQYDIRKKNRLQTSKEEFDVPVIVMYKLYNNEIEHYFETGHEFNLNNVIVEFHFMQRLRQSAAWQLLCRVQFLKVM